MLVGPVSGPIVTELCLSGCGYPLDAFFALKTMHALKLPTAAATAADAPGADAGAVAWRRRHGRRRHGRRPAAAAAASTIPAAAAGDMQLVLLLRGSDAPSWGRQEACPLHDAFEQASECRRKTMAARAGCL
jgi:hypothetical protein